MTSGLFWLSGCLSEALSSSPTTRYFGCSLFVRLPNSPTVGLPGCPSAILLGSPATRSCVLLSTRLSVMPAFKYRIACNPPARYARNKSFPVPESQLRLNWIDSIEPRTSLIRNKQMRIAENRTKTDFRRCLGRCPGTNFCNTWNVMKLFSNSKVNKLHFYVCHMQYIDFFFKFEKLKNDFVCTNSQ